MRTLSVIKYHEVISLAKLGETSTCEAEPHSRCSYNESVPKKWYAFVGESYVAAVGV
jgi:hypothetical protein